MAKFRVPKTSFLGGELSPTARGRVELPQYAAGVESAENMIPLLTGASYRRPGTFYEDTNLTAFYGAPRLIPFVASRGEAYCLAFGSLLEDYDPNASPAVPIVAYRAETNIDKSVKFQGLDAILNFQIATGDNALQQDVVQELQYIQSVDVLYFTHPTVIPGQIRRVDVDDFEIASYSSGLTGAALRDCMPYLPQNATAITMTPSVTTGLGTLTASAAYFTPDQVGSYFKIQHGGTYGLAVVTGYTSSTVVDIDVLLNLGATTSTLTWWESAWSNRRGWPRCVFLHKGRLGYAGTKYMPDSIWFSQTGNYAVFSKDDIIDPNSEPSGIEPFTVTLSNTQRNDIQWAVANNTLSVGTRGDEWVLTVIDSSLGWVCGNITADSQTAYGSDYVQAARQGNEVMFLMETGFEVRALVFDQLQNSYTADPIQLLFDEYPKYEKTHKNRRIRHMAWDESRKTLWCCDTAGNFFGLTRDRNLRVNAWHRHVMGGYDPNETGLPVPTTASFWNDPAVLMPHGSVVSLAVVPNPSGGFNDIWLNVKRVNDDGTFSFNIQRMIGGVLPLDSSYSGIDVPNYFSDEAAYMLSFPAPGDYTFYGDVTHLEGKELEGTAHGVRGIFNIASDGPVNTAAVDLDPASAPPTWGVDVFAASLGLAFNAFLKPVRVEAGSVVGTSQGAVKRIDNVTARFYKTLHARVGGGPLDSQLETINFRPATTPMNDSPELFTGDKLVLAEVDYDNDGYLYFLSDKPLPFCVVFFAATGTTYD